MRIALALLIAGSVGCTDRALLRNVDAAYTYQRAMYKHACPQPPTDLHQQTACGVRDAELTRDYVIIGAALDAVEKSQGGKLPTAATDALKDIEKQLDKEVPLP